MNSALDHLLWRLVYTPTASLWHGRRHTSRFIQQFNILMQEWPQLKYTPCQIRVMCVRPPRWLVRKDTDDVPGCSSNVELIDDK